jgi:hypothetical protein
MWHFFRGQRWSVQDSKGLDRLTLGLCEHDIRKIQVPIYKDTELALDTTIHECLHASFPDISEEAINESASDIACLLYKLGWRLTKNNMPKANSEVD